MEHRRRRVYKPNAKAAVASRLIGGLLFGVWGALFLGGIGFMIALFLGVDDIRYVIPPAVGAFVYSSYLGVAALRHRATEYEVLDGSIRKTSGILTTNKQELDTDSIVNVEYKEYLFDGLTGTGTVVVEQRGDGDEFEMAHLDDGRAVYERLREEV